MMLIYNYDENGQFTYPEEADEDPLNKGAYLIPANATHIPPPELKPGEVARWSGSKWTVATLRSEPTFNHRYAMVKGGVVISIIEVRGEISWSSTEDVFMVVDTRCLATVGGTFDGVKFALVAD